MPGVSRSDIHPPAKGVFPEPKPAGARWLTGHKQSEAFAMHRLDRLTARALVEAGYMPLDSYLAEYGEEPSGDNRSHSRSWTVSDYRSDCPMKPTSYRFGGGPPSERFPPRR